MDAAPSSAPSSGVVARRRRLVRSMPRQRKRGTHPASDAAHAPAKPATPPKRRAGASVVKRMAKRRRAATAQAARAQGDDEKRDGCAPADAGPTRGAVARASVGTVTARELLDAAAGADGDAQRSREGVYERAKDALQTSHVPREMKCRGGQLEHIFRFVTTCLAYRRGASMYVCGCPGSGKSATLANVCEAVRLWEARVEPRHACKIVRLNGMAFTRPAGVFKEIARQLFGERLKRSVSARDAAELMHEHFHDLDKRKKPVVLVIDEMDSLIGAGKAGCDALYEVFEWPHLRNSNLCLIGIANAIDLTERFLPRLRARQCEPEVLDFAPYTKEQIIAIIQQRIDTAAPGLFTTTALQMCATRLQNFSGDMRKALDTCKSAVELAASQDAEQVTLQHMSRTVKHVLGSPYVDTITELPQHQQIVLYAFVRRVIQKQKQRVTTAEQLYRQYAWVCRRPGLSLRPMGQGDFLTACASLADAGILNVPKMDLQPRKRKALWTKTEFRCSITDDDLAFALDGNPLFAALHQS